MNDLLGRYIGSFLHPKDRQLSLRHHYSEGNTVSLTPETQKLTFEESLGVSWFFAFMQAFYALVIIYLGIEFFRYEDELILIGQQNKTIIKIFFVILEVVLFPIGFWFYAKFWSNVVTLFCRLFDLYQDDEKKLKLRCDDLVAQAMSCHALLIFPFFGKAFTQIAQAVYIYQGLRVNLCFNVYQALAVLIFPLFLIFISFTLMFISLAMLFAGF